MTGSAVPATSNALPMSSGASPHELFALTDEQILNIEPPVAQTILSAPDVNPATLQPAPAGVPVLPGAPVAQPLLAVRDEARTTTSASSTHQTAPAGVPVLPGAPVAQPLLAVRDEARTTTSASSTHQTAPGGVPVLPEPPPWLAAQMKDPWNADEARELWDGVRQAHNEAAAYREVFAKPEEARAAADRARTLEEIDAAFYGGAGKSPEEQSAGRAALAQRMLREDPAAFREMVFAGLRALESAAQTPANSLHGAPPFRVASSPSLAANQADAGLKPGATQPAPSHESPLAAYTAFEKSANEDLERSVGGAIHRSLEQALPNLGSRDSATTVGAPYIVPLQERLAAAVRDDVESALKSDQQLGEQIARVLSARRFDETTRAQVVRLINDRAQQLVPVAARRVVQEWTQTALAAHRNTNVAPGFSPASGVDTALHGNRANPAPPRSLAQSSSTNSRGTSPRASALAPSAKSAAADRAERDVNLTTRTPSSRSTARAVDYRQLSDEQILDL